MKKITLTLITLIFSLGMFSQTGNLGDKNPEACKENLSLYTGYLKQKMYPEAIQFWNKVLEYCPEYNSNLYDNGAYILKKLLKTKGISDARKTALKDSVLWVYSQNIKLFGENSKINGKYGYDLIYYKKEFTKGAELLKKAIDKGGDATPSRVISKYAYTLNKLIASKKTDCDELVNEYERLSEIIEKNKDKKGYDKAQAAIDKYLGPCLTCEKLLPIIREKKFEKAKTDAVLRKSVLRSLKKRKCTDNDVFITLAEIECKENPTSDAYINLAVIFKDKGDYTKSFNYFDKAAELAEDNSRKGEIYIYGLSTARKAKKSSKAKEYANKALAINPNNSDAIQYKASLIARSGCATTPFEQKALNWAAYDMAIKAGSSAAARYKANFPTGKEIFENGLKAGATYKTCNGISTKVRAR